MPRTPQAWTYQKETLPDGSVRICFDNGMVVTAPALPGADALERIAREMCQINYQILDRANMPESRESESRSI